MIGEASWKLIGNR